MVASARVVHLVDHEDTTTTLCGQSVQADTNWRQSDAVPVGEMRHVCRACFNRLTGIAERRGGRRRGHRR